MANAARFHHAPVILTKNALKSKIISLLGEKKLVMEGVFLFSSFRLS